jgi:hypothetical protein
MFRHVPKSAPREPLRISWPEVNLSEDELQQYFRLLLSPQVFLSQLPFLFGPPFVDPEDERDARGAH